MNKPNNVVSIPCKIGIDFFKKWFVFLQPLHGLTNREIDLIAAFVKERFELSTKIQDEALIDQIVMNEDTKRKVREECGMSFPHFQVIMSKFKKNNIIIENEVKVNDYTVKKECRINPRLIPNIKKDDKEFVLVFYLKINE